MNQILTRITVKAMFNNILNIIFYHDTPIHHIIGSGNDGQEYGLPANKTLSTTLIEKLL